MNLRPISSRALALLVSTALAACGGGGSGGSNNNDSGNATTITSGVLVDPYIEGGVLQELTLPARALVQESSTTGANGAFTFLAPLTRGNLVVLSVKGMHAGAPYTVRLERRVDVASGSLVVSPLTTLLAAGRTPAQVIGSLDPVLSSSLAPADLTADPMARATSALDTKGKQLLAASIAVSGALQLVGGNATSADVPVAANAIGGPVLAALGQAGTVAAGANAGAALADFIARNATPATVGSVAAAFDAGVITSLVQTAASGQPVVVTGDGAGGLVVTANPGTVSNHVSKGIAALQAGMGSHRTDDLLLAANEFSAAVGLAATDGAASQSDLDKARFFGGLARVALLAQPYSDATDNGLNDFGDILDAFGMSAARLDRGTMDPTLVLTCQTTVVYTDPYSGYQYTSESCKIRPIATASPRSGQLQAFLAGPVEAALRQVVTLLGGVSATFTARLTDGPHVVDFDRTDALFLKGVAQGMIALIELQQAYNLDVDLHAEQVRAETTSYQPGQFLANNPSFLRLAEAASVAQSRADALLAIDTFIAAVAALRAEPAGEQANDLIKIADERCSWNGASVVCTTLYNPEQQLADATYALTTAKAIGTAPGNYTLDGGTPADATDDAVINPSRFFAGVDLRALLPARFDLGPWGDHVGLLPDSSFGGVVVRWPAGQNPNIDLDGDGLPDHLGGYTQFGRWLLGNGLWNYGNVHVQFAASGSGFVVTDYSTYPMPTTYSGTYSYTGATLTCTYTGAGPGGAVRTVVVAQDFWESGFSSQVTHYGAGNVILQQGWDSFQFDLSIAASAIALGP